MNALPVYDEAQRQLAHEIVDLVFDHINGVAEKPVVKWTTPSDLAALVSLDRSHEGDFASLVRTLADHSIQLHHPAYIGHQVCPPFPQAVIADFVISALNQSAAVWEMSPIATMVEKAIVRWAANQLGYPEGSEGTAVSGGSAANLTALLAARKRWRDDPANTGKRPVLVCSADAHYSVARAASIMGMPPDAIIKVATDAGHRLSPEALGETLAAIGKSDSSVLAIVATCGSTAAGSFDDMRAIAALRDRYQTWLHVDAAHGASTLLSPRLRHLVEGIELSDSVCWDPHKMMWMPLSLGLVFVKNGRHLREAFEADAPYLFDRSKASDNIGEMTIQCSKRADAVKLWLTLRTIGLEPFARALEQVAATTTQLFERIEASDDFESMHRPQFNIFCFRWRGDGALSENELAVVNARLRQELVESGKGWITSTVLKGKRVLRVTVMNPQTDGKVLDTLLEDLRAMVQRPAHAR